MTNMVGPRDPALLAEGFRGGESSPSEEIEALLDRVEHYESTIEALLPDETHRQRRARLLSEAEALEKRWPDPTTRPPLYGVVVGVKDLFHAPGFPTRAGSRLPPEIFRAAGAFPGADDPAAESVRLLREAGALVLGKTVTTEFAYFGPGPTRNPWNPDHTPGGSSSGSAAAVAAGFCHVALGTQTIGSISRPATFCGIAGFKPGFGRVSVRGVVPFSPNADHVGLIAPTARALRIVAPVLLDGGDGIPRSSAPTPRKLRTVLVPAGPYLEQADQEALRALGTVCERLQEQGVTVHEISAFPDIEAINEAHQEMIAADFARVHRSWYEEHRDLYHVRSRELVKRGKAVSAERHADACSGRAALRSLLEEALQHHGADFWLAPATVGGAPAGIHATGSPIMNLPWTYAGLPTVSLPVTGLPHGLDGDGLPLGVQIAGTAGGDAHADADRQLLARAELLERLLR
jgi:Asp-tRNA(Asn)/Glu-tRNA(Gln) amidotransferase A subunit family amidase